MNQEQQNQAEKKEIDLLLNEGIVYKAGRLKLHIRPLFYGTILKANKYAMQVKINALSQDNHALMKSMDESIKPLTNFIAVCTLGKAWKIYLFRRILAWHLRWTMPPREVPLLTLMLLQMYDLKNFITSTRLISQMTNTNPTKPDQVATGGNQ